MIEINSDTNKKNRKKFETNQYAYIYIFRRQVRYQFAIIWFEFFDNLRGIDILLLSALMTKKKN